MWSRFLPHMIEIQNIISCGLIGKLISLHADHGQNLKNVKNPRLWELEYGGGALLDLGVYLVSFAHLILGNPKDIIAAATLDKNKIDLQTSIILKYQNGAQALLHSTMINSTPCKAVIYGELGYIEIDPIFYSPSSFKVFLKNGEIKEYPNNYEGHGLREQALGFKGA